MAISGRRLDRPSAVGDEGRPRGTSLTIAAVVVVAVLLAAGFLVGQPLRFLGSALLVGVLTTGLALLSRDRLWPVVLGHLLFLPSAVALSAVVLASGLRGSLFLVCGALVAIFGVSAGWNDAFDRETIQTALVSNATAYVVWIVGLVAAGVVIAIGFVVRALALALTNGADPAVASLGLLLLAGLAAACLYVAVRAIPAIQLTPAHRRPAARERYGRLRSVLGYVTVGAFGLLVVAIIGLLVGVLGPVLAALGTPLAVVATLTAIPLACVAVLSLLIAFVTWVVRRVTTDFGGLSTWLVGAAIAGSCYTALLAILFVLLVLQLGVFALPAVIAVPFVLAIPLLAYLCLFVVLVAQYLGLIPDRAGSSALTAAGLVAVGLGGGLAGFPSLFVFGAVAGGLVVWDVGSFGLGVTAELGHIPQTRRLELYHGVIAVGIGAVATVGLTLLDIVRRPVGTAIGTPATMGLAVLGVLLVAILLRG